jgi:hypothetical protein
MRGVKPDKVFRVKSKEDNRTHTVYLWTTPLNKKAKKEKKTKKAKKAKKENPELQAF